MLLLFIILWIWYKQLDTDLSDLMKGGNLCKGRYMTNNLWLSSKSCIIKRKHCYPSCK